MENNVQGTSRATEAHRLLCTAIVVNRDLDPDVEADVVNWAHINQSGYATDVADCEKERGEGGDNSFYAILAARMRD